MMLLWALLGLALQVTPRVCAAPCPVVIAVRIPPADSNNHVRLLIESGGGYLSYSEQPVTATQTSVRWTMTLPMGDYGVTVALIQHDAGDHTAGSAISTITVR